MSRSRQPRGGALVPVICIVVGIVVGFVGCIVPRFFNVDFMNYLHKQTVKKEAIATVAQIEKTSIKKEVVHPKELELRREIADVRKQRTVLEDREKSLAGKTAQFDQERKSLAEIKKHMDEVEQRMKKSTIEMELSEQKNIKRLAKMWAQMEPTEVASLIKGLEIDTAVKVMATMQERQSAPILGAIAAAPATEKLASELVVKLKQIKALDLTGAKKETR